MDCMDRLDPAAGCAVSDSDSDTPERPLHLLVMAIGNPSRGDDALGPLLAGRLAADLPERVELLVDFQLQVEHALDLERAALALFIDAQVGLTDSFRFAEIAPQPMDAAFSHALRPEKVLGVMARLGLPHRPAAFVLGVRASRFELGEGLSATASDALDAATAFTRTLLAQPDPACWRNLQRG